MKLFSILAVGVALVAACPPPFNNPDLIGVDDIAAYIEEHRDNGTSGWADAIGDWRNLHRQWPREKARTETLIQYCYYDPGSKIAFEKIVGNALKMVRISDNMMSHIHRVILRGASTVVQQDRSCWSQIQTLVGRQGVYILARRDAVLPSS